MSSLIFYHNRKLGQSCPRGTFYVVYLLRIYSIQENPEFFQFHSEDLIYLCSYLPYFFEDIPKSGSLRIYISPYRYPVSLLEVIIYRFQYI